MQCGGIVIPIIRWGPTLFKGYGQMSFFNPTSLRHGLQSVVNRALHGLIPGRFSADAMMDPYGPAPINREDLCNLFELPSEQPWTPDSKLLASERRELDSMSMIRGALYPRDAA